MASSHDPANGNSRPDNGACRSARPCRRRRTVRQAPTSLQKTAAEPAEGYRGDGANVGLVSSALNPVFRLLARSVLATPRADQVERVTGLWTGHRAPSGGGDGRGGGRGDSVDAE